MVWALGAPTYIYEFRMVSLSQIVEYCSIVKISQVSHVLDFLEFRRVYL